MYLAFLKKFYSHPKSVIFNETSFTMFLFIITAS